MSQISIKSRELYSGTNNGGIGLRPVIFEDENAAYDAEDVANMIKRNKELEAKLDRANKYIDAQKVIIGCLAEES